MTNVHKTCQQSCSRLVTALGLIAALNSVIPAAQAQGLFSGTQVSGGASEVINVNRRSFGTNVRIGHDAGDTFGRQDSVTHVSLSPYFNVGSLLAFGDVRLARANVGGLSWAFGGGARTFIEEWDIVTGINAYHASDNITGTVLRNWGIGADVLTESWEFRANYLQPTGNTSQLVNRTIDQTSASFAGNNIVFNQIDTVAESLEVVDTEVGRKLPTGPVDNVELRAFFGAYRFSGLTIPKATGWKTRLQADVGSNLEIGVGLNQDTFTDTTVAFNATLHFGGFKAQDYTSNSAIHHLADPVRRPLTVPSIRTDVLIPGVMAINPVDGLPIIVRHVDENDLLGPFLGTVDDPMQSISAALGLPDTDIVLAHAGGLYSSAPDNSVVVGPGVSLFGEGLISAPNGNRIAVNTTPVLGITDELILPGSPTFLANTTLPRSTLQGALGNSVTLSEGSRLGGLIVDNAGGVGVTTDDVGGTVIRDVLVSDSAGAGILLTNTTGTTTIIDTIISGTIGPAFHVNGGDGSIGYRTTSVGILPPFSNIDNASQQAVLIENTTAGGIVNLSGITISDAGTGIDILNSAGSATIDNAEISGSSVTGIRILDSSGTYSFRNSLNANTLVSGALQQSVLIENLAATGRVSFTALQIDGRNAEGIDINNNSGQIEFLESVVLGTPGGGVAAGLSVDNSQAGSQIRFENALTMTGSGGRGIELINNQSGSNFTVIGQASAADATLESVFISNESGLVTFEGGITIPSRNDIGISIGNSNGTLAFSGGASVTNLLAGNISPAVDIQNSEANVLFGRLNITDNAPSGGIGVNLENNIAGGVNTARHTYEDLNINVSGTGFQAINNTSVRILDGSIDTTGGAAIDLEESGWSVELDTVSSDGSADNAIRLVNLVPPADNTFVVNPDLAVAAPGSGGTIQGTAGTAVQLQNAGQVSLRGIQFQGNATDILVENSGLAIDDDQSLQVVSSSFTDTAGRIIETENLTLLRLTDSLIDDGGSGIGPDSIQLNYTERTNDAATTRFDQFDNPYTVEILRNVINDTFDNTIVIQSFPGAADAHLDVNVSNNINTLDLGLGGQDETAVTVDWTGPSRIVLASNDNTLNGDDAAGNKAAYNVTHRSTTDEMLLSVINNLFTATDDGSVGLTVQTFGQSDILVDSNAFTFGGSGATGMLFNLAPDTELFLTNNELRFDADGGTGIQFTLVNQPSTFTINNNRIGLFDDGALLETGMDFQAVIGVPNLIGNQDNLIFLTNPADPNAFIERLFQFGGAANGQIIVNGALLP
ncbi:MAG: inverse autotransporter beta domain-containing protein [Fuerstiella sp.]|nr:inverse autotransporter beta domain-containing protein [Fuerstiella sp.]